MRARLPVVIAALWWGSLSTIGFLAVPLLFAHLPTPAMAGAMAARLFTAQTWVSVVAGVMLLVLLTKGQREGTAASGQTTILFILAGLTLALLVEFAVAPRIVARENLALWHRLGSAMYLLQWLCAGLSLWRLAASVRPVSA